MKKIFTLVCAALMTLGTVKAEVLLNEHFAQTTETLATNTDALPYSGEIATSGWTNIMGGSGNVYVNTTNDLTYSGYKNAADGTGSAEFKASFGRRVASPLSKSVNSGSVYMAGIVKISEVSGSGKDYLWALGVGTSGLNSASSKHYARPYVMASGGGFKFGIAKLNETSTTLTYSDELAFGTYLVVVEYTFVDGTGNDIINMYINPTKGDKPATASLVPAANTQADASAAFGSVILYSSSSNKAACLIDELKVVTEWSELWDNGGGTPTPTINVSSASLDFGNVTVGEAAMDHITVSGSNLDAAISVFPSGSEVEVGTGSISIAEAEAAGGYSLSITVTASTIGDGSATVKLSSTGASDKIINIKWNASEIASKISIADAKLKSKDDLVSLNDVVVIRKFEYLSTPCVSVQDATGAMNLFYIGSWNVGDKITNLEGPVLDAADFVDGFFSIYPTNGYVAASGVSVDPFAVTLSNVTQYGPALVKVTGAQFTDPGQFAVGSYNISDASGSGKIYIPASCDIIGEDIPAKADITGVIAHPSGNDLIEIRSKADVANRIPTGIDQVQSDNVQSTKLLRNGQLVIVKDGKMFNVLGTEL